MTVPPLTLRDKYEIIVIYVQAKEPVKDERI